MSSNKVKIGNFLTRYKEPIQLQNSFDYKRITIKTKHQGIFLRDNLKGSLIGTKLQFIVKEGQFLLSKIDARLGAFSIVPAFLDGGIITGNFWAFDVDAEKVNIEWFNVFTSSGNFYEICNQASSGTTHRKYLDEKKFLSFEIYLPSIADQNLFIEKYRDYKKSFNSLNREFDQQKAYLHLLRQTILQEAIQGKLTRRNEGDEPAIELLKRIKDEKGKLIKAGKFKNKDKIAPVTEDNIPFELPGGWVWCRLSDIATVGTGATPFTSNKEFYNGNINWITSSATGDLFITKTEKFISEQAIKETNCKVYPIGTLIVAMYGQGKTRGQISELLIEAATNQACASIELILKDEDHRNYIKNFFQKIYLEIRELAEGGAQPNLNLQKVKDTLVPLPPLAEQKRIVAKVQVLQQRLSQLDAQVHQSQQYSEAILQNVLSESFEQNFTPSEFTRLALEPSAEG